MRSHRVALFVGLCLFGVAEAMAFVGVGTAPHLELRRTLLGNAFVGSTLLGCFVIIFSVASARDRIALVALGAVFEVCLLVFRGDFPLGEHLDALVRQLGSGFGLIALAFAVTRGALQKPADPVSAERWATALPAALVIPSFIVLSQYFLALTVVFHPSVLDPALVHADSAFGTQWSVVFGAFAEDHVPVYWLLGLVYLALPLACAVVFAGELAQRSREVDVLTAFVVVGFAGWVVYHLCPVVGPRPFFHDYPTTMPDLSTLVPGATSEGIPPAVRNCVPSLHTAWGLTVWWHASRLGRGYRAFGLGFFLLTECATLGLGEHYVVDLVVAFPFTLLVRALVCRAPRSLPERIQAAVLGGVLLGLWLVLLRVPAFVTNTPAVLALSFISVVGALVLENRLTRTVTSWAEPAEA